MLIRLVLARAVSATPPSIVIVAPVLGGPESVRVVLSSTSSSGRRQQFTGVLVHRVTRPLRGSVSCGSGWSVPCVSIQLTLSQENGGSCGSGWSVPCVSIQLTLAQ